MHVVLSMTAALPGPAFDATLDQAAAAGADAIELSAECPADMVAAVKRRGVAVAGVAALARPGAESSAGELDRASVDARLRRMLDIAVELDARYAAISPVAAGREADHAAAYNALFDSLLRWRHEAEDRAIALAVDVHRGGLLPSPLELCDLIDQANSPFVGVHVELDALMASGDPCSWIRTLGRRIVCVRLPRGGATGPSAFDADAMAAALRSGRYEGALVTDGGAAPADGVRELRRIAARAALRDEPR